jgi:hypothetical protein
MATKKMSSPAFIGRKELAVLLELSVRTVKNNETAWGIAGLRADANQRLVRYRRAAALKALKERKLL